LPYLRQKSDFTFDIGVRRCFEPEKTFKIRNEVNEIKAGGFPALDD
jgi:hypothetical protein